MFVSNQFKFDQSSLIDGDLNDFERRVAGNRNAYKINPKDDSSDEEVKVDRTDPV